MTRTGAVMFAAALAPALAVQAQVASQLPAVKVDIPEPGVSVPMADIGGRPLIELRINGRGPYRMVVDTGANRTVVDPALIAELALPSAAGTPGTGPLLIDDLAIGTAHASGMVAGRMGNILSALGPEPPRGILSAQSFPGAVLQFDFPRRRLNLKRGALPPPDGQRVFQFGESEPLPTVPVMVNGVEFRIHLDTGAPMTISLPTAAAGTLQLTSAMVEKGTVRLPSGEFPRYEAPFSGSARLGIFSLPMSVIGFSDMRAGAQPGKGVIGMTLLKDFVVSVDAAHRRLMFDRSESVTR